MDAGIEPSVRSKANPSIVLVDPLVRAKQQARALPPPPPPRRLPDNKGIGARAAAVVASGWTGSANTSVTPTSPAEAESWEHEPEEDRVQEQDEEEKDENVYVPADESESEEEENSYDLRDDMSEDEMDIVQSPGGETDVFVVSSEEDNARTGEKHKKGVKVKRKVTTKGSSKSSTSRESSYCWTFFEKVMVKSEKDPKVEELKAKCMHCHNLYIYVQGSSTATLNRHMKKCKIFKNKVATKLIQSRLGYKPSNVRGESGLPLGVPSNGYEHTTMKELIAKMVVVHNYSFRMVEHEWFNIVMKYSNPLYQEIGRKAIRAECLRVFNKEKEILKAALKNVDHISLTTDMWTSNQIISYMCVVAHYIDKHWRMQTRVLAFMELDPPHSRNVMAVALFECVTEWKIENKIVSITLDNASNNDSAVRDLKAMFSVRRGTDFEAKYFHVRCCAHIVNLVVQDGTACMSTLVTNLRETVKYFKKSPSRLHKFVEICRSLGLKIGAHLTLDVCTRWSSTYKMLETGRPYRQALVSYADSDANYKWKPTNKEWDMFQLIEPLLFAFARVTTAFSGQSYPTANIFYPHIVSIKIALRKAMVHKDKTYNAMGHAMMDKFNKYWEEPNNVMVLATFLDPRYKMKYVDWCFGQIYDEDMAETELSALKKDLDKLYQKFDSQKRQAEPQCKNTCNTSTSMPPADSEFLSFLSSTSTKRSKSELRNYMDDANEGMVATFNLLEWWKDVEEDDEEEDVEKVKLPKSVADCNY
ncbi:zinc finger BED domain-containing protein RICESLEEPER 2-like [Aegilops tauschii subsp. strangulata]|uniref:zinc finger BED domain-containing protein RICESLEEPER 2-like n=1 Tax=Aegilops tauschii subsp. strangulata TaxID=200361 RepID=UPI003CC89B88